MPFVSVPLRVFGSFSTSGPVSAAATAGGISRSATDGPRPVPVGGTIAANAKRPDTTGANAAGHGHVNVNVGFADLLASAFTDGVAGSSAQGSAMEGGRRVVATLPPSYTVRFRYDSMQLSGDAEMFTELRIVELQLDEFDPRSFPDSSDPGSPLQLASACLQPVIPTDDKVLFVQQVSIDGRGGIHFVNGGAAIRDEYRLTSQNFYQTKGGVYVLRARDLQMRKLVVPRPPGTYLFKFQLTWGIGALPPK